VDWKEGYANDPKLQVLVDEVTPRSELRFEHEDGLWVGIEDGYVEYYAWSGDGNDGGYSGRCFEITAVDGGRVILRGPWSSRAGCVNKPRPLLGAQQLITETAVYRLCHMKSRSKI
jgi:hypothetical protein